MLANPLLKPGKRWLSNSVNLTLISQKKTVKDLNHNWRSMKKRSNSTKLKEIVRFFSGLRKSRNWVQTNSYRNQNKPWIHIFASWNKTFKSSKNKEGILKLVHHRLSHQWQKPGKRWLSNNVNLTLISLRKTVADTWMSWKPIKPVLSRNLLSLWLKSKENYPSNSPRVNQSMSDQLKSLLM
jgi:hypothetical protein